MSKGNILTAHRYSKYLTPISIFVDMVILGLSYLTTSYILQEGYFFSNEVAINEYVIFSIINWLALNIIFYQNFTRSLRFATVIRMLGGGIILHLLINISFVLFFSENDFSRVYLISSQLVFLFYLLVWRFIFFYSIRLYRKKGFNYRNIIVVGYGELSHELVRYFRAHPEYGFRLLGYFDNKHEKDSLGKITDLFSFASNNNVDEIYCCLPYVSYSQINKVISFAEDNLIKVKLIADFRGFPSKGLELERYDYIPVLNVTSIPLDDRKHLVVKRLFDVLFSTIVITSLFSWLFPIVALLIKIDSKGPVFFKQKRTGKGNKTFWCWKFRTMSVNNNSDLQQATKDDNRITRVGKFLRKTSIDELPQFFNVFNGTMSVVGPRPHMLKHTEEYAKIVEKFMARHFVKPGITGLAQAKGYRGETKTVESIKNRVKLDRFYIENWSIFLDLKIILLTIITLIKGDENAY